VPIYQILPIKINLSTDILHKCHGDMKNNFTFASKKFSFNHQGPQFLRKAIEFLTFNYEYFFETE
jgi:hypothetical protein